MHPEKGAFIMQFLRGVLMRRIEYRGEVLSGYVPGIPKTTGRCGEMPRLILIP